MLNQIDLLDDFYQGDSLEILVIIQSPDLPPQPPLDMSSATVRFEIKDLLVIDLQPITPEVGEFLLSISSAQTAALPRGFHAYSFMVFEPGRTTTIIEARVQVKAVGA